MIAKFMQNQILLVDSTRRDKQLISLKVLYLLKITKNREFDFMSRSTHDRIDFYYLMMLLIKKINLKKKRKKKTKKNYYTM